MTQITIQVSDADPVSTLVCINEIGSENVLIVEHYLWHGYIVVLNYILLQSNLAYIVCVYRLCCCVKGTLL